MKNNVTAGAQLRTCYVMGLLLLCVPGFAVPADFTLDGLSAGHADGTGSVLVGGGAEVGPPFHPEIAGYVLGAGSQIVREVHYPPSSPADSFTAQGYTPPGSFFPGYQPEPFMRVFFTDGSGSNYTPSAGWTGGGAASPVVISAPFTAVFDTSTSSFSVSGTANIDNSSSVVNANSKITSVSFQNSSDNGNTWNTVGPSTTVNNTTYSGGVVNNFPPPGPNPNVRVVVTGPDGGNTYGPVTVTSTTSNSNTTTTTSGGSSGAGGSSSTGGSSSSTGGIGNTTTGGNTVTTTTGWGTTAGGPNAQTLQGITIVVWVQTIINEAIVPSENSKASIINDIRGIAGAGPFAAGGDLSTASGAAAGAAPTTLAMPDTATIVIDGHITIVQQPWSYFSAGPWLAGVRRVLQLAFWFLIAVAVVKWAKGNISI